ncbi:TIGR01244 family sulfur transferase [Novosphingobium cyanobacteriorum]|uniref:TIGR01244 family sulfur transferase n=1 Tax=Novosphingobium cyanobacteriorum TaxID=3024215 RepID=A0ABT6CI59_9SPHN|nr:TIGR01244 family sulfur transferase [Novosphingobium cyanobacteriorum]MDF8333610.1 TIGR01244 family sulfur transferase [Novosphingobium cyanobacteriorum]
MFRQIDAKTYASPQITLADVAEARALGVGLIINNRPEGESEDQTPGAEIEAAAREAGIAYVAIPVSHAGFSMPQLDAMAQALEQAGDAPVLAYCRSGTRSTLLWALTMARTGMHPAEIAEKAAGAGYDIAPIRAQVDMLAAQAR